MRGSTGSDANRPLDVPTNCCLTRRHVLTATGAIALTGLAGCLGDDEASVTPVDLSGGATCDVCGMVIADHFGPAVQVYYTEDNPPDKEGPARFDSLKEFVSYHTDRVHQGWELRVAYASDYSAVAYDIDIVDGEPYISSHTNVDVFEPFDELVFVVESSVKGAMGTDAFPFSVRDDAEAFVAEYGGRVVDWDGVRANFERA